MDINTFLDVMKGRESSSQLIWAKQYVEKLLDRTIQQNQKDNIMFTFEMGKRWIQGISSDDFFQKILEAENVKFDIELDTYGGFIKIIIVDR